jgi:hypothetical protein
MKSLGLALGILMLILLQYVGFVTFYFLFYAAVINVPVVWMMAGVVVCLRILTVAVKIFRQRKFDNELRRVISQDEMLELIRSRGIPDFVMNQNGHVAVGHSFKQDKDGPTVYTTIYADPQGYPAYVSAYAAAANDDVQRHRGHVIAYFNRADSQISSVSRSSRWITVDEATVLLRNAEIVSFAFGDGSERQRVPEVEGPTGIMLIEYGWVRHLVVEPALATTMIPITLEVQRRHSKPKFLVNGYYNDAG